jgi:tRNA pseudouridine13 synthase
LPNLPFLTSDISPVAGTVKGLYEDFVVEEIPLYEPCGSGDHVYFTIEKKGLTTHHAIRDIARVLGVRPRDIGSAGNKDSRGVTRQTLSVEHVDPSRLERLSLPRLSILSISRHRNKLRTGHLKGNRFAIKLRDVDENRFDDVNQVMQRLIARGAPNYYGPQRFGHRGDTWQIGSAVLKGDFEEASAIVAGRPGPEDSGRVREARALFDAGSFREAMHAWPSGFGECCALSGAMIRFGGDARRAVLSLDKKTLGFYVSAFQSHLFNQVLAARISEINRVRTGDIGWKHENGAAFLVEDGAVEQPRVERFEISATGPLFGKKMKSPCGETAVLENGVLAASGFKPGDLPTKGPLRCTGGRRPLRFQPLKNRIERGEDEAGTYFELRFDLPAGCYATAVLREICKTGLVLASGPRTD